MKSITSFILISIPTTSLLGQLFYNFEPPSKLFDLNDDHVHLDQPMIPSSASGADSGYDFTGISGSKLVKYSRQTNGSYLKKEFPDDIFGKYVLATADFNNDGNLDILTNFELYRFDGIQFYQVELDNWQYIPQAVLDYDKDGLLDILVTIEDIFTGLDELILLRNNGDWTFKEISIEKNVKKYETYKIFDVDNNTFPDIVATLSKPSNIILTVIFNNGTESFEIKEINKSFYKYKTSTLDVIDMDNDGDGDIMIGDDSFGIWYFINTDNFTTQNEPVYDEVQDELRNLFILVSSDFNNDGLNDVLTVSQSQGYSFLLYKSLSPYKFAQSQDIGRFMGGIVLAYTYGNFIIKNLHILDFNSDGLNDIVFTSGFEKKQIVLINKTIISDTGDEEIKFELYPNPSSDFIQVKDDNNPDNTYEILDNSGNVIKTSESDSKIDVQDFPLGIYYVRPKAAKKTSKIKRFVKY